MQQSLINRLQFLHNLYKGNNTTHSLLSIYFMHFSLYYILLSQ